jgi:beta-xylosidase
VHRTQRAEGVRDDGVRSVIGLATASSIEGPWTDAGEVFRSYRIMIGRSSTLTGPYVDQDGKPMISGGGSELLATRGSEVGPGGEDLFGVGTLAYHYYDARDNGSPRLAVRSVRYANGWPVLGSIRQV